MLCCCRTVDALKTDLTPLWLRPPTLQACSPPLRSIPFSPRRSSFSPPKIFFPLSPPKILSPVPPFPSLRSFPPFPLKIFDILRGGEGGKDLRGGNGGQDFRGGRGEQIRGRGWKRSVAGFCLPHFGPNETYLGRQDPRYLVVAAKELQVDARHFALRPRGTGAVFLRCWCFFIGRR